MFIRELKERVIPEVNRIGRELPTLLRELPELPERELEYREGAYGITELLSCPIKAEIRRKLQREGIELPVESQEIEDGFLYENLFKIALKKLYGDKFIPEQTLSYDLELSDGSLFLIDGHLDCFLELEGKVVGIELKHTNLTINSNLIDRPEQVIAVRERELRNYSIPYKYVLQSRIQKFLLEELYPEKEVEHYLVVKTQLKTKNKLGKTTIIVQIENSIAKEELVRIAEEFKNNPAPRAGWECSYCSYKTHGYCNGAEVKGVAELEQDTTNKVAELLARRKELLDKNRELLAEIKTVEEQIRKLVKGAVEINGQKVGWVEQVYYTYDLPALSKLLKEEGLKAVDYFQLKSAKVKELEKLLGDKIETVRKKQVRRKFVLP